MADIFVYFLVLSICFVTFSLLGSILNPKQKWLKSKAPIQHPPSPPALPIIGHLHLLMGSSALSNSMHKLATRHGPLTRIRLASATAVVVSDAAIAQEILKNNEMNFVSRPGLGASDFDMYKGSSFTFAEYGPFWRFMKKVCMTKLLSLAQVNGFAVIRKEETMKLMHALVTRSYDLGACIDLGQEMTILTNNVICRMVMSTRCTSSADESKLALEIVKGMTELGPMLFLGEMLGPLAKLDLFGFGRKLKNVIMKFDSLIESLMEEHEKETMSSPDKERKDVMDLLLEIYRDQNAEIKLSRNDVKSLLLELFVGGTETTSILIQWIMAELINHPKVLKKLREEMDNVVGSKRLVEESDVPNLPYLRAVVKECLRLHPPSPFTFRKCKTDCKINGYDILANQRMIFNLYTIMRDPNLWENPEEFVPERFITESRSEHYDHDDQMDIKGQNFAIIPFGSGRRGCPGSSLALTVTHGVIAKLVQCFDFKVEGGERINMEEGSGLGGMAHPILCYPIIRINPFQLATFTI